MGNLTKFPNYYTLFVSEDGKISDPWYRSLNEFRSQVGGGFEVQVSAGLATSLTNVSPGDTLVLTNTGVRSIKFNQPAQGIKISNSGLVETLDPVYTVSLSDDLLAVEDLTTTGLAARTGDGIWATRSILGTPNRITVTNGDGLLTDPTVNISNTYIGQTSITTLGTISQVGSISTPTFIQFDTAYTGSAAIGQLAYNATEGGLEFKMSGGNVTQQIGQEILQNGRNRTGSTIPNGTIVYIKGAVSSKLEIDIASNLTAAASHGTLGMTTEDIANNTNGWVTVLGHVHDLNTNAFAEGDTLWLGAAGTFTNVMPVAPLHKVRVGVVVRKHPTQGIVFVNPQINGDLNDLDDVLLTSPANGDFLTYDLANLRWKNSSAATSGVVTSVAMTVPSFLTVTGSPITSSGTLAVTLSGTALPVLNGGTGVTTSTGTGSVVLSNTPTLVTPVIGAATGTSLNVTGFLGVGSGTATIPLQVFKGGVTGAVSIQSNTSNTATVLPAQLVVKTPTMQIVGDSSSNENAPGSLSLLTLGVGGGGATQRGAQLYMGSTRSTSAQIAASTFTPLILNDQMGGIYFNGDNAVNLRNYGALIQGIALSTWSATNAEGALTFGTTASGATSSVERFRITSTGITSTVSITAPSFIPNSSTVPVNGVYLPAANTVGISANTTQVVTVDTTNVKVVGTNLVVPKTSGLGIKVDTTTPTFPFHDIMGPLVLRGGGGVDPTWNPFRGNLNAYQFTVNDYVEFIFHLPHDYAPGTDIYGHVHWAHNNASVTTGATTWEFISSYAKGHNQAAFPAQVTTTVTQTASTVQYQHMVAETVLSVAGGSATLLNSTNFEPDGIILMRVRLTANTMNGGPEPFVFTCDLHYQSTNLGTKNKSPNFWA